MYGLPTPGDLAALADAAPTPPRAASPVVARPLSPRPPTRGVSPALPLVRTTVLRAAEAEAAAAAESEADSWRSVVPARPATRSGCYAASLAGARTQRLAVAATCPATAAAAVPPARFAPTATALAHPPGYPRVGVAARPCDTGALQAIGYGAARPVMTVSLLAARVEGVRGGVEGAAVPLLDPTRRGETRALGKRRRRSKRRPTSKFFG